MKRHKYFFTGLFFFCIAIAVACHSKNTQTAIQKESPAKQTAYTNTEASSLEGKWYLQPALSSDTGTGRMPEITFYVTSERFTGSTGCNRMSGTFISKGDSLQFDSRIVSTRMACIGYNEKSFIDNLLRTNHFVIKEGVLQLMYNETILSKWVRHLDNQPIKKA